MSCEIIQPLFILFYVTYRGDILVLSSDVASPTTELRRHNREQTEKCARKSIMFRWNRPVTGLEARLVFSMNIDRVFIF